MLQRVEEFWGAVTDDIKCKWQHLAQAPRHDADTHVQVFHHAGKAMCFLLFYHLEEKAPS